MHLVCRIANALLALQNAGHARYITWTYSFHCEFDVYTALDNQAMKMENELKQWNDEIAKSRSTSHVLNLFTTQQLRVIRQQLGQLSNDRISSLPPTVISMLMSISPRVCERDIKNCLQSVKSKSSLVGHSAKKVEDTDNSLSHMDHDDNIQMTQFNPDNEVSKEAAVEKLVAQLISQLSDAEKNVYEELKGIYPDEVVYLSIKNCSNTNMQQGNLVEQASEWCLDNESCYENEDPAVILNELQVLLNTQNKKTDDNMQQSMQHEKDASEVTQTQSNDVHLMEHMLIENDIPSGLAREAAELYPNDIEQALSYCLDEENRSTKQSFLQLASTDGSR